MRSIRSGLKPSDHRSLEQMAQEFGSLAARFPVTLKWTLSQAMPILTRIFLGAPREVPVSICQELSSGHDRHALQ